MGILISLRRCRAMRLPSQVSYFGIWNLEVWNKGDLYFKQLEHAPMHPNAFELYKITITSFQGSNEHAAAQKEIKKGQGSYQHSWDRQQEEGLGQHARNSSSL